MSDTANTTHLVRTWPTADWLARWVSAETTLILSEAALQHLVEQPERIHDLPVLPYALHSEIALQNLQEQLPAALIQLGDARWVELSLDADHYMVWDNV